MTMPTGTLPGTAVLLRHAQSVWNRENRFTGWENVGITEAGAEEARRAGARLRRQGFTFDIAFVSRLARARQTLDIVLAELGQTDLPVGVSWRLNERHYGALQGLDKTETAARYGAAQFQRWRRGYEDRPPALDFDDLRHPRFDSTYAVVPRELLPATESLADTERRVVPYWRQMVVPYLEAGARVLVVAHGNTLRALVKHLERLSAEQVERLDIPTARAIVYEWADGHPVIPSRELRSRAIEPAYQDG
jgi:2,3-bisphosphoglycerate-dependent phosphoglycerate mutase